MQGAGPPTHPKLPIDPSTRSLRSLGRDDKEGVLRLLGRDDKEGVLRLLGRDDKEGVLRLLGRDDKMEDLGRVETTVRRKRCHSERGQRPSRGICGASRPPSRPQAPSLTCVRCWPLSGLCIIAPLRIRLLLDGRAVFVSSCLCVCDVAGWAERSNVQTLNVITLRPGGGRAGIEN